MATPDLHTQAESAAHFIRDQIASSALPAPRIAIVLGSGLGGFATQLSDSISIPYSKIPNFPQSTVEGHSGQLVLGRIPTENATGAPVAVMQGRVHAYEGYTAAQVTFPIRVLARLGIRMLILTNAAGGINTAYSQGQLILLSDHINLTGSNPLTGPNDSRFGLRFFDMTETYSPRLRSIAQTVAAEQKSPLTEGVYLGVPGPSFETPAEIRAFRTLGADLVGMSTVHEAIVARHSSLELLGISCVTNMAAGIQKAPLNHLEVMETGRQVEGRLAELLNTLVPRMNQILLDEDADKMKS